MEKDVAQTASQCGGIFEPTLKLLRCLGMLGFLGGLAAMSAMWAFGPVPQTADQWRIVIGIMRPIFYSCFFAGVIVLVIAGSISWWRHRKNLHRTRWFKVMMASLLIAVPALHLSARFTALRLYAAIDDGRLDEALMMWNRLGWLYVIGFVTLMMIAAIGIMKPRFGQYELRQ